MTLNLELNHPIATKPPLFRQLRRRLRLMVSTRPALYALYARLGSLQFRFTDKTTVVVDSYPRSANSFFEAAFTLSHGGREVVAHHSHAAAQVLSGVHRGLPCIVLVREPEEAIASFFEMHGGNYPISLCTTEYITFYAALIPAIDKLIVVKTSQIEARFHDLMAHLRDEHCISVEPYEINEGNRSELFRSVDETGRKRNGFSAERYSEKLSAEKKQARREHLNAITVMIRATKNKARLARARALYENFSTHAF